MFNNTFFLFIFLFISGCVNSGHEHLIGSMAPEWIVEEWVNSYPVSNKDLKGKVVLVRWWTDGCPYCINTSTSLNEWHNKYSTEDLTIVGMYHPKPRPREVHRAKVNWYADNLQLNFPIGIDNEWANLNQYWLDNVKSNWTSVSFLIDKDGIIRYIHPGGEYHRSDEEEHAQCNKDYHLIDSLITQFIKE